MSNTDSPDAGPELQQLRNLQKLRQQAEEEVGGLRDVLRQTTSGRVKLQLEAAMLMRMREATQSHSTKLEFELKKEEGDAELESVQRQTELAACDQQAHVLDVQRALETEAQTARTRQLLLEADKQFESALEEAQMRIKGLQAFTHQEADDMRREVEMLRKSLEQHLAKLKETFEKNIEDLQAQCNSELRELEASLDLRQRVAIHEVEEEKNRHINALKTFNGETLGKLQAYYEDITQDNLQLVKKLRSENEKTAANNKRLRKEIESLYANNTKMREPLEHQEALKAKLKSQLRFVEKDKLVLRNLRQRNKQLEERIKLARLEVRNLDTQKKAIRHSIGQLQHCMRQLPEECSTVAAARGALLRLRETETFAELGARDQQIESLPFGNDELQSCPPSSASAICQVVRNTIVAHNDREADLRQLLRESIVSYNDMLLFMRARLEALGVPHSSVHAMPLVPEDLERARTSAAKTVEAAAGVEDAAKAANASDTAVKNNGCPTTDVREKAGAEKCTKGGAAESAVVDDSAHSMVVFDGTFQPPGWRVTWPCARGTTAVRIDAKLLEC
ncbi:hypothetical protein Efla_005732 [Eimeria flavescens]